MSFDLFMQKQIEAIEASGLAPEEWIELHAEAFRAENEVTE
jgi:hypothetical protein